MASQLKIANTVVSDGTIGTLAWISPTPGNIALSDDSRAQGGIVEEGPAPDDTTIKIVKSDDSYGSEDKGTDTALTTSDAIQTYGANNDLWSETWTAADINHANFGIGLSYTYTDVTEYLKCTNFGFTIPTNAVIEGIEVKVEHRYISAMSQTRVQVDHVTIEVTYSERVQINPLGSAWTDVTGIQINIGDVWKTVTGLQVNISDVWKTIF